MLIVGGTTSSGYLADLSVCGAYWISSNTSVRSTTAPGVTARSRADLERRGVDHAGDPGAAGHVVHEVAQTAQEARSAGVDELLRRRRVQQRSVGRRQGVDEVLDQEPQPLAGAVVEVRVVHQPVGGLPDREVRLQPAAQQRVPGPGRVGEPAVAARGATSEAPATMRPTSDARSTTRDADARGRRASARAQVPSSDPGRIRGFAIRPAARRWSKEIATSSSVT